MVFGFSKVEEIGNVGKCKIYVAPRISLHLRKEAIYYLGKICSNYVSNELTLYMLSM